MTELYRHHEDKYYHVVEKDELWFDEDIINQLHNIKKCLKKARPKDYNNRGHQDELDINLKVMDIVIAILEDRYFIK
jgi:hypothetical protein